MLTLGDTMPSMTVIDDEGRTHTTDEFLGRTLVFWFYPKDDTPG